MAEAERSPVDALLADVGGYRLISGKISDVERRTTSGFVRGSVLVEGLGDDAGRLVRLELQNENLVALERRPRARLGARPHHACSTARPPTRS